MGQCLYALDRVLADVWQPVSHSISARNYIQLPTPRSSRIFKTLTSNRSTLSFLSRQSSSHSPRLTAFDYNAKPLLLQVLLRRSFRYRDGRFLTTKTALTHQEILMVNSIYFPTRLHSSQGTPCYSTAGTLRQSHYSYSYRPSLPSMTTTQATISFGRRHFRDRNRNKICRHRGPRSPVLLDHLPDG